MGTCTAVIFPKTLPPRGRSMLPPRRAPPGRRKCPPRDTYVPSCNTPCGAYQASTLRRSRRRYRGPMKDAEIVAIGTEILLGDLVDTNTFWLSRKLAALGVAV